MEEDCDVKPCEIKLESELILDDDCDYNYSAGPYQETNNQVPDTELLKSEPVIAFERPDLSLQIGASSTINSPSVNGAVPDLMVQIKEENTEDEDPLAGAALSVEWPIMSETAPLSFCKEDSTVFPEHFKIKLEDNSSEENLYPKKMSTILVHSEFEYQEGTTNALSQNCDTKNTCSRIGTRTCKIKDTASAVSQNLQYETLPKASNVRSQLDKLSSNDSGKRPFRRKQHPASFNDKDAPTAELYSGKKPFSCKHCPSRFMTKSHLTAHLPIHSGDKPLSCKHCPARFNWKSDLTAHLRIHSCDKPFSCKHCTASFTQKSHLTTHLRIHSGDKPFSCKHCPARFNQKSDLTAHLRIHSDGKPFSCTHCAAEFTRKYNLTTHIRIHSGEKPFSCKHCPSQFTDKSNLNTHVRIHSGEKRFSCEKCSAGFKWRKNLKAHILTHSDN